LDLDVARSFFQNAHYPDDFYRRAGKFGKYRLYLSFVAKSNFFTSGFNEIPSDIIALATKHFLQPGGNNGVAGNFTVGLYLNSLYFHGDSNFCVDPNDPGLTGGLCGIYNKAIGITLKTVYPDPKGPLCEALNTNINTFYKAISKYVFSSFT
jgi:hypothetical protein